MNIAKIWNNDYPWDVRVEKICKSLIEDGHSVHLICRNLEKSKIRDEIDGIQIHRIFPLKNSLLNNIYTIVAFFNPVWIYKIYQVVKQESIDVILVRDLPLVISALLVGRIKKIPVVFDMAENYPSMWKEHVDKRGLKFFNHITKNPYVATLMENYAIKKVDKIIVVVEESKNRLMQKNVPEENICLVSNTPDLNLFTNATGDDNVRLPSGFNMLYVGYVNGGRGLDTAIRAMPKIKKQIKNVTLVIAGGGEYLNELIELTKQLGVEEDVVFLGWIESSLVPAYINLSDVCIVPHDATEFVNSTIPNKLFDYMACQKPVLVSDAIPLKRIVNETGCGLYFKSRDSDDFAAKLMWLTDKATCYKKGLKGLNAIHSQYNWGYDSRNLKELFSKSCILQNYD